MGFFDRLARRDGGTDSSNIDNCPYCNQALAGWGCTTCEVEFVYEGGKLVERGISRGVERPERRCTSCDTPMKRGGEFTSAWEDGDNAEAYVTCPSCGYQNPF